MTESERRSADRLKVATVLVVDDSSTTRRILRRGLESAGYLVLEAPDGQEGLSVSRAQLPDLVLLDVDMPVLDGYATLEQMRADPVLELLPVLFLTARIAGTEVAAGLDLGADDYLKKPCDQAELVARVSNALRQSDRQRQLRRRAEELTALSSTDQLTGLGNRRHLAAVTRELTTLRGSEATVALVLVDVDHFKKVNDNHGHVVGDAVLSIVAARLRAEVGRDVTVVRWGGEEFLALGTDVEPGALAERLRLAVGSSPMAAGGVTPLDVTVSGGGTSGPVGELDRLLQVADQALYRAKEQGRNRTVVEVLPE